MAASDIVNQAFQSLFYGDGSWLGIILLLSLCLGLVLKWKYAGVLFLPINLFIGIDYLNRNMAWHAIIMFFATVFILIFMIKTSKGR